MTTAGAAVVPGVPEQAPKWAFDGVVRFTRVGAGFLAFVLVIGFAAINTGNNSLYIGLSFMLGALLLSGVASKGGLKHLAVSFDGIDDTWAGRPSRGRLRIANRSRLWNVRDVTIVSSEMAAPMFIPILERRREATYEAELLFQRRGLTRLSAVDLYTRYPFGFFLKKRRVPIDGEVIVYPRLLGGDVARDRFRLAEGEQYASHRPGPGPDIHSFRDYVRGDSLRHVAWKKSASLGRWIIKQTELESGRVVHIAVDPFKPSRASDDDFELLISEAATFFGHALRRGLDVSFDIPHVTLRSDLDGASAVFRALALMEPIHEPVALAVDRNSVIFALPRDVGREHERASA
jgi:uncharacterized protein (DUF58 family)